VAFGTTFRHEDGDVYIVFPNIFQQLSYGGDVNILGGNTDTFKKRKEMLTKASKDVSLDINVEKTKHILLSRHQNAE
jgi:hypothetical protein